MLPDNRPTLEAWSQGLNISFPVLSDFWPHGWVATKYDVIRSEGISERAIFIVDKKGIIRFMRIHDINADPGMNDILRTLETLAGEED